MSASGHGAPSSGPGAVQVALAGTALLAAAMGIGRFAYTPLLPPMRAAFSWSVAQAGDLASANYLGYLVGALLAATLAGRPTARAWLLTGVVGSALTTGAGALLVSSTTWLCMRLLSGVASAFCLVLGTALVVDLLAQRGRTELAALHFAGVGVGIVLSVLVIQVARRAELGVAGLWGALGLAAALLLAFGWRVLRVLPAPTRATAVATPARTPVSPDLLRVVIAYGLFGFGYVVTATFLVAIARRMPQAAVLEPLSWIVVGLLAAPSVLLWQRIARRTGIFTALRLAYALEAAGVLLAGMGEGRFALVSGGALLGATFVGITALGLSAARRLASGDQGAVIGWMTASFGVGQLIGPAVAGRLAQATGGFAAPSLAAAALLVLGLLLLLGL